MPLDASLMFRTTGSLTATESLGPLTVYGGEGDLAVRVTVPKGYGANDTILPKVHLSSDNSTYNLIAQYAKGATKPGSAGCDLMIPFGVPAGKWYVKLELVVTAASTTSDFGVAVAGIVANQPYDWTRSGGLA